MKKISDELLNKYLDNELEYPDRDFVKNAIGSIPEVQKRFEALLTADYLLKKSDCEAPSPDFRQNVMQKLKKRTASSLQQKRFLFSVLSFLGLIILTIAGYAFYEVISSVKNAGSDGVIKEYTETVGSFFANLFGRSNLSIFGSVLSFIMFATGYFLFDYQKKNRKKIV